MNRNDHIHIITTADGSHSLLNTDLSETYHSQHGAIQESIHVFIRNGLNYYLQNYASAQINILEIGFGTGLNAYLSLLEVLEKPCKVFYNSLEAYPLSREIWSQLNYSSDSNAHYFFKLHECEWNKLEEIHPNFKLHKQHVKLEDVELPNNKFDLVYFDAFAPNKQPEMWSLEILEKVVGAMPPNSVFVTYCAKGQLKRDLRTLGLRVETLPGPPGKKEMIRALKI